MNPEPIGKPTVDGQLDRMNALQRATESFRYVLLSIEHWSSPDGGIRAWLRQNVRVGAWLLIPATLVMPTVGLILWQLTHWLTMLTSIFGHLIVLPILVLVVVIVFKMITVFIKRS